MINNLPTKFPLILIILLAVFTFWVDKAVRKPSTGQDSSPQRDPDYVIENFSTLSVNHSNGLHQTLSAKKMLHYLDNDNTYLEQPRLINAKAGTPDMRIRADRANLTSNNDDVYLNGNVKVLRHDNGDGETIMTTSFLHIVPDDNFAKTDKPVTIIEANTIINAVGMEFDNNTQVIRLLSEVKFVHDKTR